MHKNFIELAERFMEEARACGNDQVLTKVASAVEAILAHFREEEKPAPVDNGVRFVIPDGSRTPSFEKLVDKWNRENLYFMETNMMGFSPSKQQALQAVVNKLGSWASAAQDDPGCCAELKAIFLELLDLAVLLPIDELPTNTVADLHDRIDNEMGEYIAGGGLCSEEKCAPGCRGCGPRGKVNPGPRPSGDHRPTGAMTTALDVLRKMNKLISLGDLCYYIREREGQGWEGPKVVAWGIACAKMLQLFEKDDSLKSIVRGAHHVHNPAPEGVGIQTGCLVGGDDPHSKGGFYDTTAGLVPWPKDWPPYGNEPCDMLVGPCSCGAWHIKGEFILQYDSGGTVWVERHLPTSRDNHEYK